MGRGSLATSVQCIARMAIPRPCLSQVCNGARHSWRIQRPHRSSSPFTTTACRSELRMERGSSKPEDPPPMPNVRVVPASPSYFSAKPDSTDDYLYLENLQRKHEFLPALSGADAPRVSWRTLREYRVLVGEPVKAARHRRVIRVLQRMNRIHPSVMPTEIRRAMEVYKRDVDPRLNRPRPREVDKFGRAIGHGERKSSTARAWLVEGEGEVLINGKSLTTMFGRVHDRESALWALKATGRLDKYNVWALVEGGGTTGQAEALTLAVARALLVHEPLLKPALRRAGCVTRDSRVVERKKPGKLKARKMPAWVKR